MHVSLVISTYENPFALRMVLESLSGQTRMPDEVVIADDGSGPETRQLIESFTRRFGSRVVHSWQENRGYRRARVLNRALRVCTGDYVVFLDGDCVPHRSFVGDHLSLAERGCFVQGVRCFVKEAHVRGFRAHLPGVLLYALLRRLYATRRGFRVAPRLMRGTGQHETVGCNLAVWRDDLLAINGYDEDFTGWGREDEDIVQRLYHLGRERKLIIGRCVVFHLDHPRASRGSYASNTERFQDTVSSGRIRCRNGLDVEVQG